MKKLMVLIILTLLVASVLPVTAQDMAEGPWIRVTNFVQDSPPVAVYLNGEQLLSAVNYPVVSEYIALSADQLRQDTITLLFSPIPTYNPLDIPHIDRPGYIFIDGVYLRDTRAQSIKVTVKAGHYYTIALIGQQADDSLQTLVMDETVALVAAR